MKIEKTKNGSQLVVSVSGRIDTVTAPEFEETVTALMPGVTEIIFDLKKLDYISSAGLRVLLSIQKKMNKQGSMKLLDLTETVMEILEITGFTEILTIE